MKDRPNLEVQETHLSRSLSELDITMIGVGAMIGAGIFVLTGIAAGAAGPALILAFALNGLVTLLTAMVYAELGSAIPEAGGGYLWVRESMGRSHGFLAGWMSWFSHAVAGSLYALGFGSYLAHLLRELGLSLPPTLAPWLEKGLALAVLAIFVAINFRGTSETGMAGNIVTFGKLAVIGLFVVTGLWSVRHEAGVIGKLDPFFPQGFGAVFVAMGFTFIAFEGYEIIVQTGEEVREPRRTIPRAVFKSLMIVVPIYILVGVTALLAVHGEGTSWQFLGRYKELGLVEAARQFMPFGALALLAGGLLSTVSALNATTFSSTRVAFAMGRDRVLPEAFGRVHERTHTPHVALGVTAVLMAAMVIFVPIEEVATAADVMFLLLFLQVHWAVLRIRREFGDRLAYGYRTPFFPWIPIAGIALQAFLAIFLLRFEPRAWAMAAGWIVVGLVLYLVWARSRVEEVEEPRVTRRRVRVRGRRPVAPEEGRILVSVDTVDEDRTALRLGAALARSSDAELLAVHAIRLPRQTPLDAADAMSGSRTRLLDDLDDFAAGEEIVLHSQVAVGHSVSGILEDVVEHGHASTVVLGWRGQVYERRIRGSIADAVLHRSKAHVLVVRDRGLAEKPTSIAAVLSDGPSDAVVLDTACALARSFATRLVLLLYGAEPAAEGGTSTDADLRDSCIRRGLPADRMELRRLDSEGALVARAIVRAAESTDLLILGASSDWVDPDHLLGAIPDAVANRSQRTVVVVKAEQARMLSWLQRLRDLWQAWRSR
ncbi:MAG: amino acid permease [Thermoanaerobaculia bacterium]